MKKVSIVVSFIIITVLSFLTGEWYVTGHSDGQHRRAERIVLYYVDPMTPGFRSEKPGIAPCGMPLEPVYADAGEGQEAASMVSKLQSVGAIQINPDRQQLIGIRVDPVEMKPMTYTLRLYGKIVPDETKIFRLNASTDSWVRTLSDVTTGGIVREDQLLAEVLAPAFYNAQVTYLVALNNVDRIMQQLGGEVRHQQSEIADNQIRVAVQTLQNLGITDAQIEQLANSRKAQPYLQVRAPVGGVVLSRNLTLYQWFKAGEQFFSIADIGKVWVYADVYEDEAMHLKPGMDVKVVHAQMGKSFDAKVSRVLPLFDPVAKTLKVRLDVDNPRYELRPDMFVDVEMPLTMPPSLHVPADSVIDSGTRKIVYVSTGNGSFEPRRVETGWRLGRQVEITGGLMSGEKVIVSGNFLVDSESRMKTAAAGIADDSLRDPVCGMYLDAEQAKTTATFAGQPYYFCSEKCKSAFDMEPARYTQKAGANHMEERHAPLAMQQPGWLDMLEPNRGKGMKKRASAEKGTKSAAKVMTSAGVIDWAGSNTKPRKWREGWGKFPGAKYLGMDQEKKANEKSAEHKQEPKSVGETPPADSQNSPVAKFAAQPAAHHAELTDEKQETPVIDGAQHANQ